MTESIHYGLWASTEYGKRLDYLLDADPPRFDLINRWWPTFPKRSPNNYHHLLDVDAYDAAGVLTAPYRYHRGVIELFIDDDQFDFDLSSQAGTICSRRFRDAVSLDSDIVEYIPVDDSRCSPQVRAVGYMGLHALRLYDASLDERPAVFFERGDFDLECNEKLWEMAVRFSERGGFGLKCNEKLKEIIIRAELTCRAVDLSTAPRGFTPPKIR